MSKQIWTGISTTDLLNKTCNIQINLWKICCHFLGLACNKTHFLKKEAWSYKTVGNLPAFSALYAKVLWAHSMYFEGDKASASWCNKEFMHYLLSKNNTTVIRITCWRKKRTTCIFLGSQTLATLFTPANGKWKMWGQGSQCFSPLMIGPNSEK